MENNKDKRAKFSTVEQISAGGAAFRSNKSEIEFAIVSVNPSRRWQLPKGLIDAGETPEIAAVREVREEAGIDCEIVEKIETIEYWYFGTNKGERVRFHKLVHFFLMKYAGGDIKNHDHEILEVRWMRADRAVEKLAFKSEKDVIEKASELTKNL